MNRTPLPATTPVQEDRCDDSSCLGVQVLPIGWLSVELHHLIHLIVYAASAWHCWCLHAVLSVQPTLKCLTMT